jgi:hypothetical protein
MVPPQTLKLHRYTIHRPPNSLKINIEKKNFNLKKDTLKLTQINIEKKYFCFCFFGGGINDPKCFALLH